MHKIGSLIILLIGFFQHSTVGAFEPMNVGRITQYVEDFSNVLSGENIDSLRTLGETHEKNSTEQVVAVIIPNRSGYELADIGLKIFRENKIGQKAANNGILLIIASEEKKIRIITGYGIDGKVPDAIAKKWIEEDIRPLVDTGDFSGAIRVFYERLGTIGITQPILDGEILPGQNFIGNTILIIIILFIVSILFIPLGGYIVMRIVVSRTLKKDGVRIETAKFSKNDKLLLTPSSTSWYQHTDPSKIDYSNWDNKNLRVQEIISFWKIGGFALLIGILIGVIVGHIHILIGFFAFIGMYIGVYYSLVQRKMNSWLSSSDAEPYKNGDAILYTINWIGTPSSIVYGVTNSGSGGATSFGGGFSRGGGSSGGGGAGD